MPHSVGFIRELRGSEEPVLTEGDHRAARQNKRNMDPKRADARVKKRKKKDEEEKQIDR